MRGRSLCESQWVWVITKRNQTSDVSTWAGFFLNFWSNFTFRVLQCYSSTQQEPVRTSNILLLVCHSSVNKHTSRFQRLTEDRSEFYSENENNIFLSADFLWCMWVKHFINPMIPSGLCSDILWSFYRNCLFILNMSEWRLIVCFNKTFYMFFKPSSKSPQH